MSKQVTSSASGETAGLKTPLPSVQPANRWNPITWFIRWIQRAYDHQIDGTGLALYRISYGIVLLLEVWHAYVFRHLRYDKIPFLIPNELDFSIPLILWMGVVILLILGLFTRLMAGLSYVFTLVLFSSFSQYEYHMFYVWTGLGLMLIFQNSGQCLSLDRLRMKLRYSTTRFTYEPPRTVSQLNYYAPVLVALAFVYTGSIFYKFASFGWMQGLGMWRPASLPFTTYNTTAVWLMNIKWLALGLGYLTVFFEFIFIFFYTDRRWRIPLMVIGIGLHLGIVWQFLIPFFGIGYVAVYLLMVPIAWWRWLFRPRAVAAPSITLYYDADCPLCARTRIGLEFFDTRKKLRFRSVQTGAATEPALAGIDSADLLASIHAVDSQGRVFVGYATYLRALAAIWYLRPLSWLLRLPGVRQLGERTYHYVAANRTRERCTDETCGYTPPPLPVPDENVKLLQNLSVRDLKFGFVAFGLIAMSVIQIVLTYNTLMVYNFRKQIGIADNSIDSRISNYIYALSSVSIRTIGLTNHAVFMDVHFEKHNHVIGVTYVHPDGHEEFLPMTDERGLADSYASGAQWVNWTFRVTGSDINPVKLSNGIRDYSAFWAHEHGIDLTHARFNIKVKKTEIPMAWEKDFLERQLANPWLDGGYVEWQNKEFTPHIRDIEQM